MRVTSTGNTHFLPFRKHYGKAPLSVRNAPHTKKLFLLDIFTLFVYNK